MGYLTISTGYKSGGFTSRATVPENVGPYEAEYVTNYESGLRANLLENHLRLSAAVFYADYEDLVGFVRRTNSTGRGNEPINENLGNVGIKGFEFESDWLLSPNLNIDLALGLLDAEWVTFSVDLNNDGIVTDNSNLDVLMAPSLTAFSAINYTSELGRHTLDYRLEARYQSRYNTFGESNDDIFYRPGTTLINGSIKWAWGSRGKQRIVVWSESNGQKRSKTDHWRFHISGRRVRSTTHVGIGTSLKYLRTTGCVATFHGFL